MILSATDLAFYKGENSCQPGDEPEMVMIRAEQHCYIVPGEQQDAFIAGFLHAVAHLPYSRTPCALQLT